MPEYTPRQYADAAMFLASTVTLSNASAGQLQRLMRAAIAAGFDPETPAAQLPTERISVVYDGTIVGALVPGRGPTAGKWVATRYATRFGPFGTATDHGRASFPTADDARTALINSLNV